MKWNHGITIVELVLVMIIMILLVSFAVYSGIDSVGKAEATELYEEMTSMKNALVGIVTQKEILDGDDAWLSSYYNADMGNGWYIVRASNELESGEVDLSSKYEVDLIKRSYMVNFDDGDISLLTPVEVLGSSVRSYESVRALVESDKI